MATLDLERLAQRVRVEPRSLAFVALADGLRKAGRAAEAWGVLGQGIVHHPDLPSARLVAARLHAAAGQRGLAAEILLEVVQQDPANDGARTLLVTLLAEQGRLDEARAQLQVLKMGGSEDARGVGVNLPPPQALPAPEDPFGAHWLVARCVSCGDLGRALRIASRAHAESRHPAVTERLTDLARAACGAPVGWVDALPERPFRALPHRRQVAEALAEEAMERPLNSGLIPLSAALWPAPERTEGR